MNRRKWHERELVNFSQKMSELLQAGLPLLDSLAIVANQFIGPRRLQILEIRQRIMEGTSLTDAFKPYPFPYPFLVMLGIAQYHGRVADTFSALGEWFQRKLIFKKTIIQKSLYPILLFCFAIALFLYFFIVLLPQFQSLLSHTDDIPLTTKWLFELRQAYDTYRLYLLILLLCLGMAIFFVSRYLRKKEKWYAIMVQLPVFGAIIKLHFTYLFTSQLGLLLQAGIGIIEALNQIRINLQNEQIAKYVKELESAIMLGIPLSQVKLSIPILQDDYYQLISLGEQTGTLADHLLLCSKMMEERIQVTVQRILRWFEPFMILCIGIMILFIVISVFIPVIQMIQVL